MSKILLLSVLLCCTALLVRGQEEFAVKGDSIRRTPQRADTAKYVNLGKIAARKAAIRSAMIPGWGQIGNGLTVYRGIKVSAIYVGGTLLAMSYIQNNNNYHKFLKEIQYREANGGQSQPGSSLAQYQNTDGLITAKDVYRRNREVVMFSFVALYAVNIIEAYVDARLKYFDVGDNMAIHITPTMINSNVKYGFNSFAPALKIGFRL
ncbi:hypothetical protein SAMN06265348_11656 [Pedobacter westerhofensis]|uniref:DUF5683 domain-containing protein n=1 Tax=Pedobacter westerhofensis TaxID=425512 RepID=A0A521FQ56_9SPHI|nr:DUF5683 domain-containing protein [Pedobacter westerhofensis]SMO98318.1 hypothetical protein SAMN06265348_11656 [Pedobacter westerhofensis]